MAINATFFRHFLAHSPSILANMLRNLTREEKWKTATASLAMLRLMREADSLNAPGRVAGYLENRVFIPINDRYRTLAHIFNRLL
ncbi:hypothetical protein Krac_6288 [Ktedonobacter racemifer DSM 44963]|uniref:Uncharacterized protein n=1 Tax=Ktedonobacter racemifer DSM 44963 TaxID=485913 RepID=D6TYQ3_KTERA|nr:hypothetical protein Krac_6288 [Ktedonobacter racemifer DSM 44963]